jgi:hypothetical protein
MGAGGVRGSGAHPPPRLVVHRVSFATIMTSSKKEAGAGPRHAKSPDRCLDAASARPRLKDRNQEVAQDDAGTPAGVLSIALNPDAVAWPNHRFKEAGRIDGQSKINDIAQNARSFA